MGAFNVFAVGGQASQTGLGAYMLEYLRVRICMPHTATVVVVVVVFALSEILIVFWDPGTAIKTTR